jgi:large subunit ribosomal protein L15
MLRQHDLKAPKGARKGRKRRGRGNGSGRGNYSGRGMKGQGARSGPGPNPGFEGGQLPLIRRLPTKRGFTNIFRVDYTVVNLAGLEERFEPGEHVTPERMVQSGLVRSLKLPIKVLGEGEMSKALTVVANRFSVRARERLLEAGGAVELIPDQKKWKRGNAG